MDKLQNEANGLVSEAAREVLVPAFIGQLKRSATALLTDSYTKVRVK